jgi:hypothetical protein
MDDRQIVRNIYELKNPSKLAKVEAILVAFRGREHELVKELRRKYNIDDAEFAQISGQYGGGRPFPPPPSYTDSILDNNAYRGQMGGGEVPVAYTVEAHQVQVADDRNHYGGAYPEPQVSVLGNRGVTAVTHADGTVQYQYNNTSGGSVSRNAPAPQVQQVHVAAHPLARMQRGNSIQMQQPVAGNTGQVTVVMQDGHPVTGTNQTNRCCRAIGSSICGICACCFMFSVISAVLSVIFGSDTNDDDWSNDDDDIHNDNSGGGGGGYNSVSGGGGSSLRRRLRGIGKMLVDAALSAKED